MNEILSMLLPAFISVAVGYCLNFVVRIIKLFIRRRANTTICGKWYAYDWWKEGDEVKLHRLHGKIVKGFLTEYRIRFTNEMRTLRYKGDASIESNQYLCLNMSVVDVLSETALSRFNLPIAEQRELLFGFWLSCDSRRNVSCGGAILSRRELNDDEICAVIPERFDIHAEAPLLVLND